MTETQVPPQEEKAAIVFYCKDCSEIVDTERFGRKYVYKCKKCGTKNVAFGTKKSICGFFKIDEKAEKREEKAAAEEAAKAAAAGEQKTLPSEAAVNEEKKD